jgi:hypothetical protein
MVTAFVEKEVIKFRLHIGAGKDQVSSLLAMSLTLILADGIAQNYQYKSYILEMSTNPPKAVQLF